MALSLPIRVLVAAAAASVMVPPTPALAAPGDLLVQLSVSSNNLVRVNPNTGAQSLVAVTTADSSRSPFFLTVAPDGTAYRFLHSFINPATSRIERVNLTTGAAAIVASNVNTWSLGGAGFVVERAGTILFTGYRAGNVQRINPVTGQVSAVLTAGAGHVFSGGVTDAAGRIYLIDQVGSVGTLRRFDPVTFAATTLASSASLQDADDMAFSSDGAALFIANRSVFGLRRIDLATNTLTTIAPTLPGALGLATGPGNTIYAGIGGSSLVAVDATSGAFSTISTGGLINARTYGLTVEVPAPGAALVPVVGGWLAARRRRRA